MEVKANSVMQAPDTIKRKLIRTLINTVRHAKNLTPLEPKLHGNEKTCFCEADASLGNQSI